MKDVQKILGFVRGAEPAEGTPEHDNWQQAMDLLSAAETEGEDDEAAAAVEGDGAAAPEAPVAEAGTAA